MNNKFMYTCKYCGTSIGNKGALIRHENSCLMNPLHIPSKTQKLKAFRLYNKEHGITPKRHPLSIEHKNKIRNSLNRWRENNIDKFMSYSRGKSICCENFKRYLRENNINFVEEYCPYPNERLYSLDIAWPDEKIAVEINGSQHYDNKGNLNETTVGKQKFFESHGWKIVQIYYKWCYGVIRDNKHITSLFDLPIHNKSYVTEIYKRHKEKRQYINACEMCGSEFISHDKHHKFCSVNCGIAYQRRNIPLKDELIEKIKELKSFTSVGKFYGVSDNAIRHWLTYYNLPSKRREFDKFIR